MGWRDPNVELDAERHSWTMLRRLPADSMTVGGMGPVFSPDNRLIAVIDIDGEVSVWDLARSVARDPAAACHPA
jgi:hypothetical protein